MTDLSKLMQNAALLDVIDKSADEASNLSAQNSYQAMRIEELERDLARVTEDAERYRWLRDHAANFDPPIYSSEAIDAARKP